MFVFTPVLCDVAYTLRLLHRSVGLNRRQPHPSRRQSLISGKLLHRHLALQVNFEHCLKLSYHSLIMHLGRPPPKCSVPKEASGKQLG